MTLKQWVNLSKDDAFKDAAITTTDRCAKVSVEITADNVDKAIAFKLKVVPVGGNNVTYTANEEKRNPNFRMTLGKVGAIDEKTIRVDDIQLPAAGGNKYKIEVMDANGKVISSDTEIETWRRLYYQVVSMDDGKGNTVPSYSLANMETHAKKYFIELEKKGSEEKVHYMKTIKMGNSSHPDSNLDTFAKHIAKAYTLDAKLKKFGMAAVFSEYIAKIKLETIKQIVTIGTPNPRCFWNRSEVTVQGNWYLWHGLDDADDAAKKWFIDGYIQYIDPSVPGSGQGYFISRANIEITGAKRFAHGGYHQVKITMDPALQALLNKKQGVLEFTIEVNIVDQWTNGFSWKPDGIDLITCARRTVWTDMPANTREYTWNHEVGHRFGMTAWGHSSFGDKKLRDRLPDGPSTLYGENRGVNDKGHQGPHCENGVTYSISSGWSGTPGCVMFGANGTSTAHTPNDYCGTCAPIVRKVDLSD